MNNAGIANSICYTVYALAAFGIGPVSRLQPEAVS